MNADGVSMMYCQMGVLKSGLMWVVGEMTALMILLSIGSMLALGTIAYLGTAMKAGQWTSVIAAIWIGSTGLAIAEYMIGEGTLPCETRYDEVIGAGKDVGATLSVPKSTQETDPGKQRTAGEPTKGAQEKTSDDEKTREKTKDPKRRHPDEVDVKAKQWREIKIDLEQYGEDGQQSIWIGNRWMNDVMTRSKTKVTYRKDEEDRIVIRRYKREEATNGNEDEPSWTIGDLATNEMVMTRKEQ